MLFDDDDDDDVHHHSPPHSPRLISRYHQVFCCYLRVYYELKSSFGKDFFIHKLHKDHI